MYQVAVRQRFESSHALRGASGREAVPHTHAYLLELVLEGRALDDHGYLADIDELKRAVTGALGRFRGSMLNELAEFSRLNPSLENFARVLYDGLLARLPAATRARVVLWEDEEAWASYTEERGGV